MFCCRVGNYFFKVLVKSNLLYRYGSDECDIIGGVSKQNDDISTSILCKSFRTSKVRGNYSYS